MTAEQKLLSHLHFISHSLLLWCISMATMLQKAGKIKEYRAGKADLMRSCFSIVFILLMQIGTV